MLEKQSKLVRLQLATKVNVLLSSSGLVLFYIEKAIGLFKIDDLMMQIKILKLLIELLTNLEPIVWSTTLCSMTLMFLKKYKKFDPKNSNQNKDGDSNTIKSSQWTCFLSDEWQSFLVEYRQDWYKDKPQNWQTHFIVNTKTFHFIIMEVFFRQKLNRLKQSFRPLYSPRIFK